MRDKLLESHQQDLKIVKIYNYHWDKLTDIEEKLEFLKKLGIVQNKVEN